MKCTKCGNELPEGVNVCPVCQADSSTEMQNNKNQDAQIFALELKEKIKKMIREEHNFDEARNYIDLYLSMIGMDAEIIEFQEEIIASNTQEKDQTEIPEPDQEKGNIADLEIEINQVPEQSTESHEDKESDIIEDISLPETKGEFLEIDDEISFEDISDDKDKEIPPVEQDRPENKNILELADESEDEILVLGADDEILELEEDMADSPKIELEKKEGYKKKDILSQLEIEINQEAEKQEKESSVSDKLQSGFEQDILATPDESRIPGSDNSQEPLVVDQENRLISSDPVESMLDDLKQKKQKLKRWLLITLAIIAFIILIITLYYLSIGKSDTNKISESPLSRHPTTQKPAASRKTVPDQNQSMKQKTYLDFLARAREFLDKNDLQNAKKMIEQAKRIDTSEALISLEQVLKKKKAEQEILKEIEAKDEQPAESNSAEERAYRKAKASSNTLLYRNYLSKYPHGKYAAESRKVVKELERKEREKFEGQLIQKLQIHHKITCRNYPVSLTDKEIQTLTDKKDQISHSVEIQTIEGDRVIINFTTGLMWHQWRETMNFQKAKWWASREHAGYFDWRLPTAEEAATLSMKDIQNLISGKTPEYELWTGDTDSSDSRNAWVYSPSRNNFISVVEDQYKQLWSVRKIQKTKRK